MCRWCACTCMAAPLLAFRCSFIPSLSLSKECNVLGFSSCLLTCTPSSPFTVLLPMMLLRNHRGRMGREGNCPLIFSQPVFKLHLSLPCCPSSILSSSSSSSPNRPSSTPLRPRSLVRLDSGWSHSWAHCRAVTLSRSLHSYRWTWDPASACWDHPAGGALQREPGSRRRPDPRSCHCRVGVGFGMEGMALRAGLEKKPVKKQKNKHDGVC